MIAPYELKNKTFSRAVRGYNPTEVDEYFDFLIDKYTEVYKNLTELEQRFNRMQSKYEELSDEEESIRSAILKAQKLGEVIVKNAEKDAEAKKEELKSRCDAITDAAHEKVVQEKEKLLKMRRIASDFQKKLYEEYLAHVEMIQAMDLDPDVDADKIVVEPADQDLKSAKESVLKGPGPDLITEEPNE